MARLLADLTPLRESAPFRRLWIGHSVGTAGQQMTSVAVALEVYDLTGSSWAVGLTGLFQLVPLIVLGLYGGALLDRFDVRLSLLKPSTSDLSSAPTESRAEIRERVLVARARARRRFESEPWSLNAQVPGTALRQRWRPAPEAEALIRSVERTGASLRSIDRLLRIAWTVADLDGAACPNAEHVATAMGLRGVDVAGAA